MGSNNLINLEIQNKIVDFIKKNPIGVTSSEIANYLDLNRMTMTKYLAIIKTKTLIDFKQLGMAKLWYIPVNISKESFFSKAIISITNNLPKEDFKPILEKAGASLGEELNSMYLNFYNAEKLAFDQICSAYSEIGKKLSGNFKVILQPDRISVEIAEHPFEENSKAMNVVLAAVFAKIASLNLNYDRTVISEQKDNSAIIDVYLKK